MSPAVNLEEAAPQSATLGLLSINLAVLLFGLAGVLGKLSGLAAPDIVFGRVLIAGGALLGIGLLRRDGLLVRSRRDVALLVAQGVVLAIHWTAFFQSILVSSVAIALLSYSTFPLFTVAIEFWGLKEKVRPAEVAGALLVLPGVALLVPSANVANRVTLGILWGILAGLTFAVLSVVNRRLSQRYDSRMVSAYQDGVAALVLTPFVLTRPLPDLQPGTIIVLLTLGLACTALAHTMFIAGLRSVATPLASLFASLEPVWGIALGVGLLGEVPTTREMIGGVIVLGALVLPVVSTITALRLPKRPIR